MKYKPSASTRAGLRALLANPGNSVILATRDFLITPELLAARYELAVGGIAFPVYSERLRLSEAVGGEADAQGALIAKETFGAFASAVAAAQTLRSTTRFSTVLSLLSGIWGSACARCCSTGARRPPFRRSTLPRSSSSGHLWPVFCPVFCKDSEFLARLHKSK